MDLDDHDPHTPRRRVKSSRLILHKLLQKSHNNGAFSIFARPSGGKRNTGWSESSALSSAGGRGVPRTGFSTDHAVCHKIVASRNPLPEMRQPGVLKDHIYTGYLEGSRACTRRETTC